MKQYSEELLAERRRINRKRIWQKIRRERKAKKPKGFVYPRLEWKDVLDKYSYYFDALVDITLRTCSSQTKQLSPLKWAVRLSERILEQAPGIYRIEREDIEQEIRVIWWGMFRKYILNRRRAHNTIGGKLMNQTIWRLPFKLKLYANSHDIIPEPSYIEYQIDELDYTINGDNRYPLSLLSARDRYLFYLLQTYPGEYTKIGKLLHLHRDTVVYYVNDLRSYLKQELDLYASTNTERSITGRVDVSATNNCGENQTSRDSDTSYEVEGRDSRSISYGFEIQS